MLGGEVSTLQVVDFLEQFRSLFEVMIRAEDQAKLEMAQRTQSVQSAAIEELCSLIGNP